MRLMYVKFIHALGKPSVKPGGLSDRALGGGS